MLSRSSFGIALLASVCALAIGCHVSPPLQASGLRHDGAPAPAQIKAAPETGSEADLTEAHAHYSAGVIAELDDEPEIALREFLLAALQDPSNESLVIDV